MCNQKVLEIKVIDVNAWREENVKKEIKKNEQLKRKNERMLRKIKEDNKDKQMYIKIMVALGYVLVAAVAWEIGMIMGCDMLYWLGFLG